MSARGDFRLVVLELLARIVLLGGADRLGAAVVRVAALVAGLVARNEFYDF